MRRIQSGENQSSLLDHKGINKASILAGYLPPPSLRGEVIPPGTGTVSLPSALPMLRVAHNAESCRNTIFCFPIAVDDFPIIYLSYCQRLFVIGPVL